ncbi:DUF4347 domain-containing protein [Paraburkholderia dilworthii]|uniref:DUF4347 domain-containing protein n=1 Tax=Paraburkholderia dilworthii TaxID=948106 RepID=A0ABW9D818_9BURK
MKIVKQFLKRLIDHGDAASVRAPVVPAPLMMALEPRVVYDASVAAVAAHPHGAEGDSHAGAASSLSATPKPVAEHDVKPDHAARSDPPRSGPSKDSATPKAAESGAAGQGDSAAHQVVFIDPSVANYQSLIAGLPAGTQYVVLNANTDGFAQIAQYLQTHKGIESIHLISHGADGEIQAGSTWLNAGDLSAYSAELTQIGAAMKPGGDFLIYGCDVAQNADGQALVQSVAALTHLNVAASTDATGMAALGGNWTLEYKVGDVHTPVIESAAVQAQYNALLGVTVETYDTHVSPAFDTTTNSFTLDGLTYTTDQPVETTVYTTTTDPFGAPPLSTGPADGVLMVNFNGTQMSSLTIQLANGSHFALSSFDIDAFSDGSIYIRPNGDASKQVLLVTGGLYSSTISLAGNANFQNLTSITIVDVGDDGFLTPTLNNFTYTQLGAVATTSGSSASFVAGDNVTSTPVAVDNGITLSDAGATTAQTATVSITGNLHSGEDLLAFNNTSATLYGNISATYTAATGVLSLTSSGGTATITQWQAALRAVTYTDTAITPNTATRTISFAVNDGISAGVTGSRTVTVADTDQTPTLSSTSSGVAYAAGAASTPVFSGVSISDRDNTTLASATVTVGGGYQSGDTLSFTNTSATLYGNIGIASNSNGVLTLTSASNSATLAQWDNALNAVRFADASNATPGARTVSFSVSDGTKSSTLLTNTVTVTAGPIVTTDVGSAAFVAGDNTASTPVAIDSGLAVTDANSATLQSATVSITGNFQSGEDLLSFVSNPATMGDIAGSYNTATGVLTLNSASHATIAQWQAALSSITYTDTAVTPNNATRTIGFAINDGTQTSPVATRTITVAATDQTPIVGTTGGTTAFTAGNNTTSTPVAVDSGISVSDLDNTTLASGSVSITGNFHAGEDVLGFTNTSATLFGNITASYDAVHGVLTLTSSGAIATVAQWRNALESVTYTDTAVTPNTATRTISFAVSDGSVSSLAATKAVSVTDVDQTPVVVTSGGSASFVAGDNAPSTPVAVDSGLTVSDLDNGTLASATVQIGAGFHAGEDLLSFTNNGVTMGNIVASYDAVHGTLTLSSAGATATLAQWQAALRSVTYTDAAVTPDNTTRSVSFTVNDGTVNSVASIRTVTVADTDQTPILTTTGGTTAFVEADNVTSTPVAVDSGVTVSDLDNTTLAHATVSITGNLHSGEDVLAFSNTNATLFGDIAGTYNAATGTMLLSSSSGTATLAQWQAALRAVTYTDTAITPNTANRTISFSVNDGTKDSLAGSKTVSVAGVDQSPVLSASSGDFNYLPGAAAHNIDSGITLTDSDSTTMASATIQFTSGFQSGDQLSLNYNAATMGFNFTITFDGVAGTLTVTRNGAMTLSNWQAIIDNVQFSAAPGAPLGTRALSVVTSDGIKDSNTLTYNVDVISSAPQLTTTSTGSVTFTAGDNAAGVPIVVDGGLSVLDPLGNPIVSAMVSITGNYQSNQDVLLFINDGATMGDIFANFNAATGVLTLTSSSGTATDGQWAAAMRAVTFTDTAVTPNTASRSISFQITDGTQNSTTLIRTVTVADTDQTPILATGSSGSASFVAGDNATSTPVAIDTGITVSDRDNGTLASATFQIGAGFHAGEDVLGFSNDGATMGNITASYDAVHGTLSLSSAGASATLAQWQAALRSVTYTDTAITPDNTMRTISFTVNDGTKSSAALTRTVTVADTDQTPIVGSTSTGSATFVSGDNGPSTPVTIDNGITLSDLDNTTLGSATVQVGAGFHAGEDVLGFTNDGATMGNITASYDAVHGTLTLSSTGATATLAQWQSALRSVTYLDTALTPSDTMRTIDFTVNDGTNPSAVYARNVDVTAADQTPILTTSGGSSAFVAGDNVASTPVVIDNGVTVSDLDNTTLASATVSITGGFHAGEDVLSFGNGNAAFGNISGSYDATTGVLTLNSANATATLAQWQAALRSVTYTDTAATPDNTTRTISFTVNDRTKDSAAGTKGVTVADVDQTPLTTTSNGNTTFVSGDNATSTPVAVDGGLSVSDRDNPTLASATVSITTGFHAGEDVLAFTNGNATTFGNIAASFDATTGVLTLTSAGQSATVAQWQAALRAVTYVDTALIPDSTQRTVSFAVNDGQKSSVPSTRTVNIAAAPVTVTQPTQSTQPMPANQVTLPPSGNGASASSSATQSNTPNAASTSAPDIIVTFPFDLTDSISNPLIVLDAFADAPEVSSIPAIHTATFTADEIGTSSYANSGSVGGSNHHGSLSDTSVGPIESTPAPTSAPLSLDLPALAMHLNVGPDQAFVVSLPVMLGSSEGLPVGADAHVELRLADGRPLPAWLHYDPVRGTLSGKVPANQHGLQIAIIAHDAQGHQTRRDVAIEFGGASRSTHSGHAGHDAQHGAAHPPAVAPNATPATPPHAALPFNSPPLAKPSLAEQFVRAHATLHVARPVNAATTAVAPETVSRGHA